MGDESLGNPDASTGSSGGEENNEQNNSEFGLNIFTAQPGCYNVKDDVTDRGFLGQCLGKIGEAEKTHAESMSLENELDGKSHDFQADVDVMTTDDITDESCAKLPDTNDCLTGQKKRTVTNVMSFTSAVSGVKRPRVETDDEKPPMVRVVYDSLSRKSKKKLEELLQHWSEWDAQQCSNSEDSNELLESGEETIYPALNAGSEKSLTVSFLLDNQVRKKQCKDIGPFNGESATLYNREYAMPLTSVDGGSNQESNLVTLEASRCFNCGSYNHSLKDCSKPRDTIAVQNARKQHQAKKNHTTGPRLPTRYYQDSPGGKYDGLKPGALDTETKKMLGLGELDPPPWLSRMREIGYPPGYFEEEDKPSGITIYGDGEGDHDEGKRASDDTKPTKKMTIDFPGINALIPENADQRKWIGIPEPPSFGFSDYRLNSFSEFLNRAHPHSQMWPGSVTGYNLGVSPPISGNLSQYNPGSVPEYNFGVSTPISGNLSQYSRFNPNYVNGSCSPRTSLNGYFSDIRRHSPVVHRTSSRYSSWQSPSERVTSYATRACQNRNYELGR